MERFVLQTTAEELESYFGVSTDSDALLEPNFNAAPGYLVPAIYSVHGGLRIESCLWNPNQSRLDITEFLLSPKAASILRNQSCIIPINGFYMWKNNVEDALPFYVRIHSQKLLGIPGIFTNSDNHRKTFTVLTRNANVLLKPLDETMPCILENEQFHDWLFNKADDVANTGFIGNELITNMTVYRVPSLVNQLSNNSQELIQPIPKLREED